jgi:hypothetical protein
METTMNTNTLETRADQNKTAPGGAKLRYQTPELHTVATAEALVQGSGCRSGHDYTYTQSYCW